MKKILFLCLTAAFACASAYAYDFKVDGIYYNLIDALSVEVTFDDTDTGVHGSTDYNLDSYSGEVVVPATVVYEGGYYDVVGVGAKTFSAYSTSSSTLTSVTLPETITYIGDNAFQYDFALTSLNLPLAVQTIGDYAFRDCSGLMMEFAFGSALTSIGNRAFENCAATAFVVDDDNEYFAAVDGVLFTKDLTEIVQYPSAKAATAYEMPATVTDLRAYAFAYAYNLEEVVCSQNIANTNNGYTFYHCEKLANITLPDNITAFGSYTFAYCYALEEITLPTTITTLGTYTFYYCTALRAITLHEGITDIGNRAFQRCEALTEIAFPESITAIPQYVCYQCYALEEVTMGNATTTIGSHAFNDCPALSEITLPATVTSIETWGIGSQSYDVAVKIYCMAETPPDVAASAIFVSTNRSALYVPAGTTAAYKAKSTLYSNFSDWDNLYDYVAQTVETTAASDITYKSATLSCAVTVGSQTIKEYGFEYWCADDDEVQAVTSSTATAAIEGLAVDTEYTYRAYARNAASGKVYGEERTFTTAPFFAPTVTTYAAAEITATSALIKGYVAAGSDALIGQGIEYWEGEEDDYDEETAEDIASDETVMAFIVEGLTAETTYSFRTYAVADTDIVYYGEAQTFTTAAAPVDEETDDDNEGDTTGISTVPTASNGTHDIYNMQGVRVTDMSQKGIYIVDGRKVLVK